MGFEIIEFLMFLDTLGRQHMGNAHILVLPRCTAVHHRFVFHQNSTYPESIWGMTQHRVGNNPRIQNFKFSAPEKDKLRKIVFLMIMLFSLSLFVLRPEGAVGTDRGRSFELGPRNEQ